MKFLPLSSTVSLKKVAMDIVSMRFVDNWALWSFVKRIFCIFAQLYAEKSMWIR